MVDKKVMQSFNLNVQISLISSTSLSCSGLNNRRSKHLLVGAENSQEALFNKDKGEGTWIGPMNETLTINTCKMPTKLFGQFYPEYDNTRKEKMGEIGDHLKMNWDDYICRQICFKHPE